MAFRLLMICMFPLVIFGSMAKNYLDFFQTYQSHLGPFGSWKLGEIEIASEESAIEDVCQSTKQRLMTEGFTEIEAEKWTQIGIIAQDQYWIWVRDPVVFPSGLKGTYDRILWRSSLDGPQGVAILPVFADGQIGVNLNYRHATRSWEIEVPRGTRFVGEHPEDTARRECREETGLELRILRLLGEVAPNTGMTSSIVPVYTGEVSTTKLSQPEDSEAIYKTLLFSQEELIDGLQKGYLNVVVHGNMIKAHCRDSFLAYALLLAKKN